VLHTSSSCESQLPIGDRSAWGAYPVSRPDGCEGAQAPQLGAGCRAGTGGPAASSVSALVSVASADAMGPSLSVTTWAAVAVPALAVTTWAAVAVLALAATVDPVDEERAEDAGREVGC